MANGTQLASDNFIRGAYPTNLGVGGDGWTTILGSTALTIASAGVLHASVAVSGSSSAIWTGLVWPNDQYSEYTIQKTSLSSGDLSLYVRCSADGNNAYRVDVSGSLVTLYVLSAGTPTQLAQASSVSFSAGDTVRLTAIGTTLVVTHNDTTLLFKSDATVASGSAGILIFDGAAVTDGALASWRGGSPSGNTEGIWKKQGVVIPAILTDFNGTLAIPGASNATCLYEGNAQLLSGTVFKAWFQGNANGIYYAESTDGKVWTRKAAAVLTGVGIPKIFKNGSTYYLHVTHAPGIWTQIDQYTSSDGITWTLAHANILSVGAGGSWDSAFLAYFQVLAVVAGTWYGVYSGSNGTTKGMGLATSPDGATWTKYGGNPVNPSGGPDQAIKIGSTYYVWLTEGVPGQIGGAQGNIVRYHTADFITWVRDAMSIEPDSVDEGRNYAPGQISVPSVLQVGGTTYMFYSASPNDPSVGSYQIRLATAPLTIAQIVGHQEYFSNYAQTASDNFARADGSLGPNWTTAPSSSAMQIASNKAEGSATSVGCAAYYSAILFHNDQYCEMTLATLSDSNSILFPLIRQSAGANTTYYSGVTGPVASAINTLAINKKIAGVASQIGTNVSMTPEVGDILRISAVGSDISFFQNEHLLLQVTNPDIASGFPAISVFTTSAVANAQISSWAGGNADVIPGTVTTPSFSPPFGAFPISVSVTISSDVGATIYYTTDGSEPSTASTLYTGPVTVSSSETLKAIATKSGSFQSLVGSATYTINKSGGGFGSKFTYGF